MKSLFILFLFSAAPFAHAIDVGNGEDLACTEATFVLGKRTYQCVTLTINGPINVFANQGGSALLIKVQNNVSITALGSIDISGGAGANGSPVGGDGGIAGPGGGNGGSGQFGANGLSGAGISPGVRGLFVPPNINESWGGGGGGGSYFNKSATEPDDGLNSDGTIASKGSNGTNITASGASFDSSFAGGSGGGAGGGGFDDTIPSNVFGSGGGGGGGAIRIVSGGNITVAGVITANGGSGGGIGATISSGAGGGGAGGSIWLQATGNLLVTGTLSANGGNGGTNGFGLNGGVGGDGGVRLDSGGVTDISGATINSGGYYHTTFAPGTEISGTRQYSSSISCARVSEEFNQNHLINLVFGFLIAGLLHLLSSKRKA